VIPRWLSRHLLARSGGDGFNVTGLMMHGPRHVPLIDAQVRRVCEACNTGWMHVLEEANREAVAATHGFASRRFPSRAFQRVTVRILV
jgi:hypothetical protein